MTALFLYISLAKKQKNNKMNVHSF